MTITQVRKALNDAGVNFDHLGKTRGGYFRLRNSYFYHHGRTAGMLAQKVTAAIPTAKVADAYDDFHHWPATSYLVVEFSA